MEESQILVSCAILLAGVLILLVRKRAAARNIDAAYLKRLEEVMESSEHTKQTCFLSLESTQRNLEALQTRADAAEEKLSSITDSPTPERQKQYEAAVLLLIAGQSPARVATLLNLPLRQVELIQELRKFVAEEQSPTVQANDVGPGSEPKASAKRRTPNRTKPKEKPVLLTDVVNFTDMVGLNGLDNLAKSNEAAA
jgi:hypothetical protein